AVLAPHRREDAELDHGGRAAHYRQHALVLVRREAMLGHDLRRDRRLVGQLDRRILLRRPSSLGAHVSASTSPSNKALPSQPPNIGSTAFSGWGISPITGFVSFNTPAVFFFSPL